MSTKKRKEKENEYNHDTNHKLIRALASVCVKFVVYFSIRTYFFYFTMSLLQNTHIRLSIILTFLFK